MISARPFCALLDVRSPLIGRQPAGMVGIGSPMPGRPPVSGRSGTAGRRPARLESRHRVCRARPVWRRGWGSPRPFRTVAGTGSPRAWPATPSGTAHPARRPWHSTPDAACPSWPRAGPRSPARPWPSGRCRRRPATTTTAAAASPMPASVERQRACGRPAGSEARSGPRRGRQRVHRCHADRGASPPAGGRWGTAGSGRRNRRRPGNHRRPPRAGRRRRRRAARRRRPPRTRPGR